MDRPRAKLIFVVVVLAAFAVATLFLPVAHYALRIVDFVRGAGAWGGVLYAVLYAAATVFMMPGSVLTICGGFIWGLAGVCVVWPGALLGATLAFLSGRFFAREWVERTAASHPRAGAVDQAIGDKSFTIILLLRLSPLLPFNMLNYVLGVTRARLGPYILASAVGMLPGSLLYVYLGSIATDAAQLVSGERPSAGPWGHVFLGAGLLATLVVTVVISRLASARLRDHVG